MNKLHSKFKSALTAGRDFLDEKRIASADRGRLSRLYRFAHFWLLVWKSFSRNRCPVRASALAYATLLALVPMLFVAVSVSSGILKKEGRDRIEQFIGKLVASVTPAEVETNAPSLLAKVAARAGGGTSKTTTPQANPESEATTNHAAGAVGENSETNQPPVAAAAQDEKASATQRAVAERIHEFIQNIRSGTLGLTGTAALLFVAISMLSRIEATFNDIWGVKQGRGWVARIVQYWGVITLGPLLLVVVLGLTSGPHFESTKQLLSSAPILGARVFHLLAILILCLAFGLFYMLMPNTKVHWQAALAGGVVAGLLWHLNNYFSVLYVSRVVTNSKIYGGLGTVPVFMVGLYFAWLILLFGAQVSYAYQNRAAYLQEKQTEHLSQRGREFIALRLIECIGQRFQHGQPPATVPEIAEGLVVPTRLVQHLMRTLMAARLVVEVAGPELAYAPARPLESITCHDILLALRAGRGEELATRDEPARTEVFGEFERILEAERKAASAVTVLAMVNRTEELAGRQLKAVGGGKPGCL